MDGWIRDIQIDTKRTADMINRKIEREKERKKEGGREKVREGGRESEIKTEE